MDKRHCTKKTESTIVGQCKTQGKSKDRAYVHIAMFVNHEDQVQDQDLGQEQDFITKSMCTQ